MKIIKYYIINFICLLIVFTGCKAFAFDIEQPIITHSTQYILLSEFHDDMTICYDTETNDFIVIDKNNEIILKSKYYLNYCSNSTFWYRDKNVKKTKFINTSNDIIFEHEGEYYKSNANYIIIKNNTNNYIFDYDWNLILNVEASEIMLYDDLICICKGDTEFQDDWITYIKSSPVIKDLIPCYGTSSNYFIGKNKNNAWGVIEINNNSNIIPFEYDYIEYINDLFIAAKYDPISKNEYRIFDCSGQLKFNLYAKKIGEVSESIIPIYHDSINMSFVDYNNVELFYKVLHINDNSTIIKDISGFHDDFAVLKFDDGTYTYIDREGLVATDILFSEAYQFYNGYALVANEQSSTDGGNEKIYSIINKNFEIVFQFTGEPLDKTFKNEVIRIKNQDNSTQLLQINQNYSVDLNRYKLMFNYNTSLDINYNFEYVGNKGSCYIIHKPYFTYTGYTFSHWTDGAKKYNPGDEFVMPDHDVTLTAVWKKKSSSSSTSSTDTPVIIPTPEKPPVKASPYNDIFNHWGRDQIEVITTKGLVDGITATEFKPDDPMTREMFVIALAKLSGVTDNYTNWAIDIGLLKGYGNGNYGLKDTITREQMAVFFERYMTLAKIDMESLKTVENTTFADDSSIADWSKSSVYTMQAMKLIQGKNNNLFDPQGLTTRAEAATVLYNLITVTGK